MTITFRTTRLWKLCTDHQKAVKAFGDIGARRLRQRLDDLNAALSLEDLRSLPGRLHELAGDRAGELAIDLVHPVRLILVAADDPIPLKPDGGLDWKQVTAVEIIEIADYH